MALDASGVTGEVDVKGRPAPTPGIYHGIVGFIDASFAKHDAVIAELEVLAGKPGDQVGRKLRHMMFLDREKRYTDQHLRFALATGVIRPGEVVEPCWKEAEGQQIVFGVELRAGKDKDGNEREYANVGRIDGNWGLAIWNVRHPEVADVPKNEAALKLLSTAAAAATGIPGPAGPSIAPAAADPYADL